MKTIKKHQKTKLNHITLQTIIAVGLLGAFTPVTAEMPGKAPLNKAQTSIMKRSPIKDASAKLAKPCAGSIEGRITGSVPSNNNNYGFQVWTALSGRTDSGASVRKRVVSDRSGYYKFKHLCPGNYTVTPDTNARGEIESNRLSLRVPGAGLLVRSDGYSKRDQNIVSRALENQAITVTAIRKTRDGDMPFPNMLRFKMYHKDKYTPGLRYKIHRSSTNGSGKADFNVACCGSYDVELNTPPSFDSEWAYDHSIAITLQNPQPNGIEQKLFFKRKLAVPILVSGMTRSDVLMVVDRADFVRPVLTTRPTSDIYLDNTFASRSGSWPTGTYDEQLRIAIYQISDQGLANQFKGRSFSSMRAMIKTSNMALNVTKIVPALVKDPNGRYHCNANGTTGQYHGDEVSRGDVVTVKRSNSSYRGKTVIMAKVCDLGDDGDNPRIGHQ